MKEICGRDVEVCAMMTRMGPPTQWDRDMVGLLSSLALRKLPPKLRYHFFANTFPLAYHYAWALLDCGKKPEKFVKYSPGFVTPQKAQWGYSTLNDASSREHVKVSLFRPRLAFVERTLWTHRVAVADKVGDGKSELLFSTFLEAVVRSSLFEHIVVYAEIPQLGAYLQGISSSVLVGSPKPVVYSVGGEGGKLLLVPCAQENQASSSIRFFIYGGPLSTYLNRKRNRYIALGIEPAESAAVDVNLLQTVLILPDGVSAAEREDLESYHRRLYGEIDTKPGQCAPFSGVYRAFNEVAWLLQSRASFRDAMEFRSCIVDHHGGVESDDDSVSVARAGG
jgi:hypothetical protein